MRVAHVTFEDVTDWQDQFADPGDGGKPLKGRAANLTSMLKRIFVFGALVLPRSAGCNDVCDIFAKMAQAKMLRTGSGRRKEYMTAVQCRLIRIKAHEKEWPSIALAQALAFELGLRQKDVIGEWLPVAWPGVTDIHCGPRKWMIGLRWEEIDENLILAHRLSKSVRGKAGVMDSDGGKMKAWDLRACPMVMDELQHIVGKNVFDRSDLPTSGPMIVHEQMQRPWSDRWFREIWRVVAQAAGVPTTIQNRDSRPGAATEADLAGAPKEKTQRLLGIPRARRQRFTSGKRSKCTAR